MGNMRKCVLWNEVKGTFNEENICKKNGSCKGMNDGKIQYVVYIKKKIIVNNAVKEQAEILVRENAKQF